MSEIPLFYVIKKTEIISYSQLKKIVLNKINNNIDNALKNTSKKITSFKKKKKKKSGSQYQTGQCYNIVVLNDY